MAESQMERLERDFPPEKRAELYDQATLEQRQVVDRLHTRIATAEPDSKEFEQKVSYLYEYLEALSDPLEEAIAAMGDEVKREEVDVLPLKYQELFNYLGVKGTGRGGQIRPSDVDIAAGEGKISTQMYEIFLEEVPTGILEARDVRIPYNEYVPLEESPGVLGQTIPVYQSTSEKLRQHDKEIPAYKAVSDPKFERAMQQTEQTLQTPFRTRKFGKAYTLPSGRGMPILMALERGYITEDQISPGGKMPGTGMYGPSRGTPPMPDYPGSGRERPVMETSVPAELIEYSLPELLELEQESIERGQRGSYKTAGEMKKEIRARQRREKRDRRK